MNLIKAQAMGAIPVTSRQPNSSFPEVCGRYDLGPPVPEGAVAIQSDPAWFQQWVDAMVHAASTPPEQLEAHRLAMVKTARETFDWRAIVATWHDEFLHKSTKQQRRRALERQEARASAATAGLVQPSATEANPSGASACADAGGAHGDSVAFSFGNGAAISGTRFPPVADASAQLPHEESSQLPPPPPPPPPSPPPTPSVPPPQEAPSPPPSPPPLPSARAPKRQKAAAESAKGSKKRNAPAARAGNAPASQRRCGEAGTADARMAAGRRAFSSQKLAEAFDCFLSAAQMAPDASESAEAWYMAGGMHVVSGQPKEAMSHFERALVGKPDHPHALFELGNAHLALGAPGKSLPLFSRAATAFSRLVKAGKVEGDAHLLPTALSNLGNALNDLNRPEEALAAFERAAASPPPICLAFNGLSNAYETAGRFDDARDASIKATRLLPDCEYAYYNLGRLTRSAGLAGESIAAFSGAFKLKPNEARYVNGLGTALQSIGRNAEATSAYLTAIRLQPSWGSPYRNLGLVFNDAGGRAHEAIWWFTRTVELEPTSAETYCDMGTAGLELGQQVEALERYRYALTLAPDNALAHANEVHLATKLCSWQNAEAKHRQLRVLLHDLLARVEARKAMPLQPAPHLFLPPYHALAYDGVSPSSLVRLATAYADHAAERSGASAAPPRPFPSALDTTYWLKARGMTSQGSPEGAPAAALGTRLTVGYLTTDFGDHPTSHLMRSVWKIQRDLGRSRAICFARSDDGSAQRAYIARTCEEFVDLTQHSWSEAAAEIRKRKVMVLVDLNGHCGRPQFELLSLRPAPVQISYMGHPGTSGASYVQYLLTDRLSAPPNARQQFSEHLLSLHIWHVTDYRFASNFAQLGTPPSGAPPAGPPMPWPAEANRKMLGLPADDIFVFATFSQLYKVTPPMYSTWINALKRATTSRLWMLQFPLPAATSLGQHAAAEGVHMSRLLSAPTAERSFHLARISLANLCLDTSPYNGHTTTGDATWMGTPSLTLRGDQMQSRIAAGYAMNAGCPQLISRSYREYEELASAVARRPSTARAVRECLARHRWTSAAFDTRRWVHTFDEGARMMWELQRQKTEPMHLLLPNARHVANV